MAGFSSDETVSITKNVDVKESELTSTPIELLEEVYELNKCSSWIVDKGANKVCLQFPDSLLPDAAEVALCLEKKLSRKVYILGDTSYGSCCVDEVAAEHVSCEAIVHFGHACLSPTRRLPVLYVFPKKPLDAAHFASCLRDTFPDTAERILLLYDVSYAHHIDSLSSCLSGEYDNLVVSRLDTEGSDAAPKENRLGRAWDLGAGCAEGDYHAVFIGGDGRTLTNFALTMSAASFRQYDPASAAPALERFDARRSRFLMSRLYLVERVKDARTLGLVVGTLGVSRYLEAIGRVKALAAGRGKKCYIFAVGKPNVAKLANFPEIDAFVLIACPENSQMDSKEFYRPVVTPFEVELACGGERPWSDNYITDFRDLLPGGRHHVEASECPNSADTADVSLITGRLRNTMGLARQVENGPSSTVAQRADLAVSTALPSGSEFLLARSWRGLEQDLGQTEARLAEHGQSGVPQAYASDREALRQPRT
ncbi:2-(3-amino-3-carboxypropyl)histidine synthase subunit 2 [Bacillus rossius redtenbacheri]|uniref:2-(3-amino-3-carboxypropyl)histidine synthase subunit 2 n=1 Tax=Bacillus rossius redtenbacheri TaxID=93214 RepID=UPI002FDD9D45